MMSKQNLLKIQSCVLKVNIHCRCEGCEQKVKKLLQKIDGVYSVSVDAEQGKVVVAGDVDPAKLVKKLKRAGKHAEIWGGQKGVMCNPNNPINHQFQNLQLDNTKVGKDNTKSQNQKGQQKGDAQLAHFQNIKEAHGPKVLPAKEHKSVKFNLPEEEFEASDDGFDDYDDSFDDYDEEEEEEEEEAYSHGHGPGHGHVVPNKMMPMMGNGRGPIGPSGMMNGPAMNNNHKGNGAKKGDVIDQVMQVKGKGGNSNLNEAKIGNNGGGQKGKNSKGERHKGGGGGGDIINKQKNGKKSDGGGLLGRFIGFGKKSKKVEEATFANKSKSYNNWDDYENHKGKEGKKGGKLEDHSSKKFNIGKHDTDFEDFDTTPPHKNGKSHKGIENVKVGQMGPIMGNNYPMDQMNNIPAMNGQGMMQMQHAPYNPEQQQYMAMMMNQQGNMNNHMYPTSSMMYGRPHPSMNHMMMPPPVPMPSHPMADPITHSFSDENVESCSIM
ncbi:hypothetical protein RJT34_19074 [Clitoria ternatea]|uniref:HMA domain-containing protein n=1 Tax=Clitoria ternatea TaxID=43366 RepID=A0AAN9P439_CLITE